MTQPDLVACSTRSTRPHVVVVGGGFGGVAAVRRLARADLGVTLVDQHGYSTFNPLLYQVATGTLNAGDITYFLRSLTAVRANVSVVQGRLARIDTSRRAVLLEDGRRLSYDHLVLATGVQADFFGVPGAQEHTMPLYGRAEALALRDAVFGGLESAAAAGSRRDLRLVVIGGGATGVETAGAFAEMRNRDLRRLYPEIDPRRVHVTLVERAPHVLEPLHPRLRRYAQRALLARHVDLQLGTRVLEVVERGVVVASATGRRRLDADVVVWAAGVAVPSGVARGLPTGPRGRIVVDDHCRVPGHPGMYAVGDIAANPARPLPQVATPALQMGGYVARDIIADVCGRPHGRFRYRDRGAMAVIGRGSAVAQIRFLPRMVGLPAWLAWLGLHVVMLLGTRNRMATLTNLAVRYLGPSRNVIVGDPRVRSADNRADGRAS